MDTNEPVRWTYESYKGDGGLHPGGLISLTLNF